MEFDRTIERPSTLSPRTQSEAPRRKEWIPKHPIAKLAMVWTIAQLLLVAIFEGIVISIHNTEIAQQQAVLLPTTAGSDADIVMRNSYAIRVYEALLIASQVFQLLLALDAVWHASFTQLASAAAFSFGTMGYSAIAYYQGATLTKQYDDITTLFANSGVALHQTHIWDIVVLVTFVLFCTGWVFICIKLYRVFGWSVFKQLGADIQVRERLKLYHVYMVLLKVDVFFFIGFSAQFIALVLSNTGNPMDSVIHGCVAFPLTIGLLLVAFYAVTLESFWLMMLTLLGLSGGIGYIVSKLYDAATNVEKYIGSRNSLIFFETITLLLCITTFVIAFLNYRNFGKGLKEQLRGRGQNGRAVEASYRMEDAHGRY
ncbi:uncharacterized protein BJ171DRAFT_520790 [Polychytrium aggregatum]|uniref:uncharacterized protein n=1 Tax=Polychytrium aggregatum TaxID=110093 RepID=UPI0022FF1D98|nr:uncharacterized protein BJ171DRAFT_520790 [Polychytrium aggregatum]KAI9197318.1 hypothetical protein BJ171DRAFT_520790 [Polychytrium aggregatum]